MQKSEINHHSELVIFMQDRGLLGVSSFEQLRMKWVFYEKQKMDALNQQKKLLEETLQKIAHLTADMDRIQLEIQAESDKDILLRKKNEILILNAKLQNEKNKLPKLVETIDQMDVDISKQEQDRLNAEARYKKHVEDAARKLEDEKKAKLQEEEARLQKEKARREQWERDHEAERLKKEALLQEKAKREEEARLKEEALIKEETDLREAALLKRKEAEEHHKTYIRLTKEATQLWVDEMKKKLKRISAVNELYGKYCKECDDLRKEIACAERRLRNPRFGFEPC